MKILGIVLIVGGILGLTFGGSTHAKETVEAKGRTARIVDS